MRRGKKKVQSSHLVDSGVVKAALAKVKQKGEMVTRKRQVMKTILIVTLFSFLRKNVVRWVEVEAKYRDLLLTHIGGLTKKWCAIIAQMKKINEEGIRKFVTQVQNIQIFWKN